MFVMTRLSVRSRTAMHSSAILSIMACARSASIAFSHRPSLYMQLYPRQALKRHAPALVQAGTGVDAVHREVPGGGASMVTSANSRYRTRRSSRPTRASFRSAAAAIAVAAASCSVVGMVGSSKSQGHPGRPARGSPPVGAADGRIQPGTAGRLLTEAHGETGGASPRAQSQRAARPRAPSPAFQPSLLHGDVKQVGEPPLRVSPSLRPHLAEDLLLRVGPERSRNLQGTSAFRCEPHRLDPLVGVRCTLDQT